MRDGGKVTTRLTVFAYGDIKTKTHERIIAEVVHAAQTGQRLTYTSVSGSALIDKNRSIALTQFWKTGTEDVMIMLDHDMVWETGWLLKVAQKAVELQTIVGGVYSKRKFGGGVTCCDGENEKRVQIGTKKDDVESCTRLGGGFTAIPRFVPQLMWDRLGVHGEKFRSEISGGAHTGPSFDRTIELAHLSIAECKPSKGDKGETVYDFFRNCRMLGPSGDWQWYGEDFAFCARALHCGIKPLMHVGPAIGHIGDHTYTVRDAGMQWPPTQKSE